MRDPATESAIPRLIADGLRPAVLDRIVASLAGATILLALSPVWTQSFGYLDDYPFFWAERVNAPHRRDLELLQGRPISAIIHAVAFAAPRDVADLAWVRAAGVVCLSFVAFLLFLLLRRLAYRRLPSWCLAVGILWLPSTQVFASWTVLIVGSITCVLAVLAAWIFDHALDGAFHSENSIISRAVPIFVCSLVLTLAVCTYQSPAMLFWPLAFLCLMAPKRQQESVANLIKGAMLAGLIGAAACVGGYLALRVGAAWVAAPYSRTDLVSDIRGKATYLYEFALPRVLDPWVLTPRTHVAFLTGLGLLALLPCAIRGNAARKTTGLLLGVIALPLSYLPNILVAENWATSRSLAAAYVVPLAVMVIVIDRLPAMANLASGSAVLIGGALMGTSAAWIGHHQVSTYFAAPQHEEWMLAEREIVPALTRVDSPVVVVRSDWSQSLAAGVSMDEFGIPSTYASYVPVPFTQLLVHERTGHWLPDVTSVDRAALGTVPATSLVVDYGRLLDGIDNPVVYRGGTGGP
jgi:hypothetical protein